MPRRSIWCWPILSLASLVNRSRSAFGADLADALRRQLEAALLVLDQPGLLEHAGQLGQALAASGRRRRPAGRAPGRCRPRPARPGSWRRASGSRAGRCRRAPASCRIGLGEAQRIHALEVVAPVPAHLREHASAGAGRAGPSASAGPCRRAAGRSSCWSCARCSGVIELSIACMAAIRWAITSSSSSSDLRVLREEVAEALHELLEPGILAPLALLEHLVEPGQHVLHALHLLGRHVLHGPGHLVDVAAASAAGGAGRSAARSAARASLRGEVVLLQLAAPGRRGRAGSMSSWKWRSVAASLGELLARAGRRCRSASPGVLVERVALLRRRCRAAPRRCRRRRRRGRTARARPGACRRSFSISSRRPCSRSPLRSRKPLCIMRRSALLRSPWYSRSSVISVEHAVGVELEADLRAVPAGVGEPAAMARVPPPSAPSTDRGRATGGHARVRTQH